MEYRKKLDSNILESLKIKIFNYMQSKGLKTAKFMKSNMDKVENIYVEDSDTRRVPKMQSRGAQPNRPAEIMINKKLVELDENDKPIDIDKKLEKIIRSQLGHELIHQAARYNGYTGILNHKNNRGLNEGLTQMFTEKIFGYVVSPNTDAYKNYKKIAKILDITFGENVTLNSYFNHTDDLEQKCNELAKDNNFYRSINDTITSMYQLRHSNLKKDKYYASLINPIYEKKNELVFQKICAQIIVPKLKTMPEGRQTKYITQILESVKDDSTVTRGIENTISNFGSMNKEQLNEKTKIIDKQLKSVEQKNKFINQLYSDNDYNNLVTISEDGAIHPKENNKITIKNKQLQEKILSGLFFQDRKNDGENEKQHVNEVINECQNQKDNVEIELNEKEKDNILERKKKLSSIKYTAKENGYLVLNSISECEQSNNIQLNAIKAPTKKEPLSFQDLKKVYESYTIDYEENVNNPNKMYVKNRSTNEKTEDLQLSKIAKFASIWAEAAGIKWIKNEKIHGITYAFSEQSEQIFNQLGTMIKQNMTEKGSINTQAIYKEISNSKYKYSENIINTLFANPTKLKIIYDFYKMQTPKARLETELPKTSSEFRGGVDFDKYIEVEAKEIVKNIKPSDITDSTLKKGISRQEINEVINEIKTTKKSKDQQLQR